MSEKQTEAQRLADWLDDDEWLADEYSEAADELRPLDAVEKQRDQMQQAGQQVLVAYEADDGLLMTTAVEVLRQALEAKQREDNNLAEAFRVELDKQSQRIYELRMEVTALKSAQKTLAVGA